MEQISLWFEGMSASQQIFWGCAIAGGLLFALQTLFTLFGFDVDGALDFTDSASAGDTLGDGGAMQLFSLRSLINFVFGYGLAGVCLGPFINSTLALIVIAIVVGALFVAAFIWLFRKMMGLESHEEWNPAKLVGKTATVYLRIPSGSTGKIQVSLGGSVHEFDATSGRDCPSGDTVVIKDIRDSRIFVVE